MASELVIRICFRSGGVSEERGTEQQIEALFNDDIDELIDYVMALDVPSGEFSLWHHENDPRWENVSY